MINAQKAKEEIEKGKCEKGQREHRWVSALHMVQNFKINRTKAMKLVSIIENILSVLCFIYIH